MGVVGGRRGRRRCPLTVADVARGCCGHVRASRASLGLRWRRGRARRPLGGVVDVDREDIADAV